MNWEIISAVSELVGAVAVIVSLIYLALQVKQNTRIMRAAAKRYRKLTGNVAVKRHKFWRQVSSSGHGAIHYVSFTQSTGCAPGLSRIPVPCGCG